jgi:hypothetical protein
LDLIAVHVSKVTLLALYISQLMVFPSKKQGQN